MKATIPGMETSTDKRSPVTNTLINVSYRVE